MRSVLVCMLCLYVPCLCLCACAVYAGCMSAVCPEMCVRLCAVFVCVSGGQVLRMCPPMLFSDHPDARALTPLTTAAAGRPGEGGGQNVLYGRDRWSLQTPGQAAGRGRGGTEGGKEEGR